MRAYEPIPLEEIETARRRIAGTTVRTPLVPLDLPTTAEVYLKLESLQPIGSFKLRGAGNALSRAGEDRLAGGVWTASAGNMGQGVAWHARRRGLACSVVVPETAPQTKLDALSRLGAEVIKVPFAEWLEVFRTRRHADLDGFFVHPFSDPAVMAGNGTIGLEILEDLPDVDAVLVPYGGGGLLCGIASAIRALRPACSVYACEVETAAPFAASLAAGQPVEVSYEPSFVDGIGAPTVFPEMFGLARRLVAGSLVVSLDDVAKAVALLIERARVVAEGAGATPVAAALANSGIGAKVACVVSGGNIDRAKLAAILDGAIP